MNGTLTREDVRRFQLPCGCFVVDTPGGLSIDWCPHHEMLHGVIPLRRTGPGEVDGEAAAACSTSDPPQYY
jgi:hypothetical protein